MGDEFGSWGGPAGGGRSGREGGPFTFPHIHTRAEEEKIAWKEGPPKTKTLKFVPFPSLIILPPFDFLLFRLSPSNPPPSSSFSREAIKRASLLLLLCRKAARRKEKVRVKQGRFPPRAGGEKKVGPPAKKETFSPFGNRSRDRGGGGSRFSFCFFHLANYRCSTQPDFCLSLPDFLPPALLPFR